MLLQVADNADAGSSTGSEATVDGGDRFRVRIKQHVAETVFGLVRRALDKERVFTCGAADRSISPQFLLSSSSSSCVILL